MTPGIALQLYTVREDARQDFAGTLRRVAEIGYPAVQLAGYGDLPAGDLKRLLDDLGLRVAGAHVALERLTLALEEEVEFNATLGNHDLICPILPASRRQSEDDYRRAAADFSELGRRCRDLGVRFSYHNHAFEFEPFGETSGMLLLLDESDPETVFWEPDVYWIAAGGHDPVAWLHRYAGRCPLIHLKDMTADEPATFAEVGEGVLDFQPIFEASADADWHVVEQDTTMRPPLESAAISLAHLREWGRL